MPGSLQADEYRAVCFYTGLMEGLRVHAAQYAALYAEKVELEELNWNLQNNALGP